MLHKAIMHILNILPVFFIVHHFKIKLYFTEWEHSLPSVKNTNGTSIGQRVIVHIKRDVTADVNDQNELQREEEKPTEGVVAHTIIIDHPALLELHVHIVPHLEGYDHSVAPHVIFIRPCGVPDRRQTYVVLLQAYD